MAFRNKSRRNVRSNRKSRKNKKGGMLYMDNPNKTKADNRRNWEQRWKSIYQWDPSMNWPGKTNLLQGPSKLTRELL